MKKPRILSKNISSLLVVGLLGALQQADSATVTWDGGGVGGIDLGTANNWSGDVLPSVVTPDTAQWDGSVAGPLALIYSNNAFAGAPGNLGLLLNVTGTQTAPLSIDSGANTQAFRMDDLTLAAGSGAFTLGDGANTFNVTLGGVVGQVHNWTNNSANTATIGSDVVLGLGGGGAHTMALGGTGNWTFNNAINLPTLLVTKAGAGAVQFNAATSVNAFRVNNGTVTLNGTTTGTAFNSIGVGAGDNATMNLIGAASFNAGATDFNIGDTATSRGTVNMNSTGTLTVGTLYIGKGVGSVGVLNMNSGTLTNTAGGDWRIGGNTAANNQGYGVVNLTGGTITTGTGVQVGASHVGVFNQTAGTFNGNSWVVGARFLVAGATSFGQFNLSGGSFNQNAAGTQTLIVAEQGTAVMNISGTAAVTSNSTLGVRLTNQASANGTINLLGGTLTAKSFLELNGLGTSYMYLNGGTLRAGGSNANFISGLDNVVVGPNNAIIDTNTFAITIPQTLAAPTGDGVITIPVTDGGSGYAGQPVVQITGDGVGATATANVVGGVVTSITITNPGINYISAPTITLIGGGATTAATVGTPTLGANVTTGGLIKTGTGTLTLAGFNSYLGPTTISGGTLAVDFIDNGGIDSTLGASSSAAANLVLDGGALRYTGGGASTDRGFTIPAGKTGVIDVSTAGSVLTISGGSVGAGNLSKIGAGVLDLSASTGHTGTTSADDGILSLTGTMAGPLLVGAGRVNADYQTVGVLTTPSLTLGASSGMDFDFGSGNDLVVISNPGGLTLGSTTLNLYAEGGTTPFTTNGTYPLFDYNSTFNGSLLSAFSILNSQPGKIYSIANNPGTTTIELTIGNAVLTQWAVDGSGSWNVAGNWTSGIPNSIGASATFGAVITSPATVTVDGPKTVGNIIFDNLVSYTVTGSASDIITLNNGLGTATISAVSGSHSLNAPIVLVNPSVLNSDVGASLTIGGNISGAAGLTKIGDGAVTLSGTNTYTTTTISAGTLGIGNGGTTGTLGSGNVTIGTGATLIFNRSDSISVSNNISGAGNVAQGAGGTTTYTGIATHTGITDIDAGNFIVEGTINGTTALNVDNASFTFGSATNSTIAGPTTIAGDAASSASLFIGGGASVALNGAINVGNGGGGSTGSVTVNTTGAVTTTGPAVFGSGFGASGSFTVNSGTVTQTGANGIVIGRDGGTGTYTQTGGTVNTGTAGQGVIFAGGGSGSNATATISGGSLNAANEFWVSDGIGNTAALTMSAGAINAGSWLVIGRNLGTGTLNLSGGTITKNGAAGNFIIIGSLGGTGTVNQTGGALNATAGGIRLGENNGATPALNALWDMSGGSATVTGEINVGWRSSEAIWNISGAATTVTASGRLIVGAETSNDTINTGPIVNGAPVGTINMSGGTVTFAGGDSRIGGDISAVSSGAQGIVNVSGGTLNFGGNLQIGAFGQGTMTISGSGVVNSTGGFPVVGRFVGGVGVLNVNGGTFNQTAASQLIIAEEGTGTLNLNSGSVNVVGLRLGHVATGNGTVNLNGGTLSTGSILKTNASSTAAFKFNGGTLRTTAANPDLFQAFPAGTVTVESGGAVIDTNGFDSTITQVLVPGTPGGGLTKNGDGTLTLAATNAFTGATTVNDGTLTYGASQTLSSLVIGDGATVVLGATPAPGEAAGLLVSSPEFGGADAVALGGSGFDEASAAQFAAVPEPGAVGLLLTGVLGLLGRRRRSSREES